MRRHPEVIWAIPRTWQMQELLAEVLNGSGFDTDADGDVLPVLLLCDEMELPHCSHRSGPVLPTPLDID